MKYRSMRRYSPFDFKQLGQLPGPVDLHMVEKAECEGDASFPVDRNKSAVADSRYNASSPDSNCFLHAFGINFPSRRDRTPSFRFRNARRHR